MSGDGAEQELSQLPMGAEQEQATATGAARDQEQATDNSHGNSRAGRKLSRASPGDNCAQQKVIMNF